MDKKKKVIAAVIASLTGVSGATVASAIIAYEAIFQRVNRPDYSLVAGDYCYERVADRLIRQEFYYPSAEKGVRLRGYYYSSLKKKGLVIVSHGMKAGGDDYLPIIEYMVNNGYDVFSYDATGTYSSEGKDTVGMCQSLIDLQSTINYVKSIDGFKNMPIFLIGHSWGAYACSSVLSLCGGISGCALIAGMYNATTLMTEKAEEYVGKLANVPAPVFSVYQKHIFGDYVKYSSVNGINSVEIPVIIAHGEDDQTILFNKQSIISHRAEITNKNVQYYVGKGLQGDHNNIWHSIESAEYQLKVKKELKALEKQKGAKLTEDEKRAFYKSVNHSLYSQVNEELMQKIVDTFDSTLNA